MFKKLYLTLLATIFALLIIPFVGSFNNKIDAYATDYRYSYNTSKMYEVDYINDNGGFDYIDDFNDFNDAKALMKTNKDYVVRCREGYSPTQIVAMNSGLVYSYPRGSSATQDIYQEWGDNKYNRPITYVERRYEMTYVDTPYMSAKSDFLGQGYVEVVLNGFNGFADVEYTDLVPTKFIDNGLSIYLGGAYASNSINAYKVVLEPNYYIIKRNGNYDDLEFHYHYAYPTSNGYAEESKLKVDNAANYTFMQPGVKYYSDDGYTFYTDYMHNNLAGVCYNYYQFLPIRTKTNITAAQMDGFLAYMRSDYGSSAINGKGYSFIENGDEFGFNGALLYALACQESGYGTSDFAIYRNNLFGWNAFDDSPSDASYFSSVDIAIREQMGRNLRKYADYSDSRYNGAYFGNKGSGFNLKYASDPYWGMKIAAIYYNLDKYSNNFNGNLTDHNSFDVGLIKTYGAPIYYDEACTRQICTANYSYRQVANMVTLLEDEGKCFKIRFSNPIWDGVAVTGRDDVVGYSWSRSIAYVKAQDIEVLNKKTVVKKEYPHEAVTSVSNVTLNENTLTISGIGAISNLDFTDTSKISHIVEIISFEDPNKVITVDAGAIDTNGFSMNDGFNYKYAGFSATINLDNLDLGSYYATLTTTNDTYSFNSVLRTTNLDHRNLASSGAHAYRFTANQNFSYRAEIDVQNTDLDYSLISKPSKRESMKQFNSLSISDDGIVEFSGYSMVYYLNYPEASTERYELHLIDNSSGVSKIIPLENIQIADIIKKQINSVYDISYIGFTGTIDLKELPLGDYTFILQVKTSDGSANYYDLLEFAAEDRILPSKQIETKNYEFHEGLIRNRLMLSISEVQ